jgi:hypothetical protein
MRLNHAASGVCKRWMMMVTTTTTTTMMMMMMVSHVLDAVDGLLESLELAGQEAVGVL